MSYKPGEAMDPSAKGLEVLNLFFALQKVEKIANSPRYARGTYNNAGSATQLLNDAADLLSEGQCPVGHVWNPNTNQCESA